MPASNIPLTLTPDSSQIHGYGYDPATGTLAVAFKSNHQRLTYHYPGVTAEEFAAIQAAKSTGGHIHLNYVRNGRNFDRMENEEPAEGAEGR